MAEYSVKFPVKLDPYAHQAKGFELSHRMRNFAYFMEMGTGKTKIVIDQAVWYYQNGWIDCLVVVAPKGVYRNWTEIELPKHLVIDSWDAYWTPTHNLEVRDMYQGFFDKRITKFRTFLINVEALSTGKGKNFLDRVLSEFRCMMAVDESTTIKNTSAQRTKNCIELGRKAKIKRIMSGDPVTRSPMDLYGQCLFLDPALLGHSSIYSFKSRYAVTKEQKLAGNKSFQMVVGYQRLDELQKKLLSFSYRVKKDDCLDLPPKTYMSRDVELTEEQIKIYKKMRDDAFAEFEGKIVTAPMVITRLLRLHQIVCGHFKDDNGNIVDVPTNRITQLMEALDEIDGKVVIWATYRRDIEKVGAELSRTYGPDAVVHFHGGTEESARIAAVNRFQNHNDVRFFLGNPAAGRFGLTLTASSTVVYYSNSYDLEHRIQSEDRVHRIGQTRPCTYLDLVARGTVDQRIIAALLTKRRIAAETLGDRWKEWL